MLVYQRVNETYSQQVSFWMRCLILSHQSWKLFQESWGVFTIYTRIWENTHVLQSIILLVYFNHYWMIEQYLQYYAHPNCLHLPRNKHWTCNKKLQNAFNQPISTIESVHKYHKWFNFKALPKTNIAPENRPSEKEFSFPPTIFQVLRSF